MFKLIILDLDGTLLHSDKSISQYTINTLEKCRSKGILIGISSTRETNAKHFISKINPEVVISSRRTGKLQRQLHLCIRLYLGGDTKNLKHSSIHYKWKK
ncbi:MAG: HAD family hydrolase [Blautia marasmi]